MAKTKGLLHRRPQSAPKFSNGVDSSKVNVENLGGGQDRRERRIGRTSVNWTGNEEFPKSTGDFNTTNRNSLGTSFDFRKEEGASFNARRKRSQSAPFVSVDDDVFVNVQNENDKVAKKLDVDLSILETVANANDQNSLSNRSARVSGQPDKNKFNFKNKASYISTSDDYGNIKDNLQRARPRSILSNNRANSARPGVNKKVCIVERPKSCFSERSAAAALRKFNENFRIKTQDYLPRRSFFSCHDNVLVNAGINPKDLTDLQSGKGKPKICDDNSSSSDHDDETNNGQENASNASKESEPASVEPIQTPDVETASVDQLSEQDNSEIDLESSLSNSTSLLRVAARVTGAIVKMKKSRNKSTSSAIRRRHLSRECEEYDSKNIKVDPKPIVDYLKLVKEKPSEYLAMKGVTGKTGVGAIDNLVSAGKIYSSGTSQNLVAQAAYELGSKTQPKMVLRYEAERAKIGRKKSSTANRSQSTSRPQSSTSSSRHSTTQNPMSKLQNGLNALSALNAMAGGSSSDTETETNVNGNATSNGWAEVRAQMTDVERKRAEVEHWLKKLTTGQVVKAREMALKELGEESSSIRRWWISHKFCRYLRKRTADDHVIR